MIILRILFYPFIVLYGLCLLIRNKLFDLHIIPSYSFSFPVISVGNLTVGGAGKTPLIEYLILLLKDKYRVAVLSRGYKRKSRGFLLVDANSTSERVGDEALQIKRKFSGITVAVDVNRIRGINLLKENFPEIDVILLDDAFQYRSVKPGLSILLTDFHNLYPRDHLFPFGTLREPTIGYKRADILMVTKTDRIFSPLTQQNIIEEIKPKPYQSCYFSYLVYGNLLPLTIKARYESEFRKKKLNSVLLVTGIANPYPIHDHLNKLCNELVTITFADHHKYSTKDVYKIKEVFENIHSKNKLVITTEKDSIRLQKTELLEILSGIPVYYLPIQMEIHKSHGITFNERVMEYVGRYK